VKESLLKLEIRKLVTFCASWLFMQNVGKLCHHTIVCDIPKGSSFKNEVMVPLVYFVYSLFTGLGPT
jgi:hypothetical protein